jgi:hypothetical protein
VNTPGILEFDFIDLTPKVAKTLIILAQNFRENNADSKYILYVFLFLILIFSTCEIAKTYVILAKVLGKIRPILSIYAMYL